MKIKLILLQDKYMFHEIEYLNALKIPLELKTIYIFNLVVVVIFSSLEKIFKIKLYDQEHCIKHN